MYKSQYNASVSSAVGRARHSKNHVGSVYKSIKVLTGHDEGIHHEQLIAYEFILKLSDNQIAFDLQLKSKYLILYRILHLNRTRLMI